MTSTLQPDDNHKWDPGGARALLAPTIGAIVAALQREAKESNESSDTLEWRTDLDSHANMPVVGRNVYILAETDKQLM